VDRHFARKVGFQTQNRLGSLQCRSPSFCQTLLRMIGVRSMQKRKVVYSLGRFTKQCRCAEVGQSRSRRGFTRAVEYELPGKKKKED
jgi:hypothetical protein